MRGEEGHHGAKEDKAGPIAGGSQLLKTLILIDLRRERVKSRQLQCDRGPLLNGSA